MGEQFKVSLESPQSGFMSVSMESCGRRLVASVAHAPYDSLRELIEALVALLEGRATSARVRWNREPEEFDFEFMAKGEEVTVSVARYPDHRRLTREVVFTTRQTKSDVCRAFWGELRQLRRRTVTDEFEQNWRRAFPEDELRRFTKTFRAHRRHAAAHIPTRESV